MRNRGRTDQQQDHQLPDFANNYYNRPPQNQSTLTFLLDQVSSFIAYGITWTFASAVKLYDNLNVWIFPVLKQLVIRYGSILVYLTLISNLIIVPFGFITFKYFHDGVVSETIDFSVSVSDLQNQILFVEDVDEDGIVVTDIIDVKVHIDTQEDSYDDVFGRGPEIYSDGEGLDFDLDLNLNCFCNSAIDNYLVLNYHFSLENNAYQKQSSNSLVSKSGILILNCQNPSLDSYFHLGDIFPYWINTIFLSQFWQDLPLWQIQQANNHKIQLLKQFNLEQSFTTTEQVSHNHFNRVHDASDSHTKNLGFDTLVLTLKHTYNSLALGTNSGHDHFQFLIDPRLTTLTLTKDLTYIKWFLKTFPRTSVFLGTFGISLSMNLILWTAVLVAVVFKEIDERDDTGAFFANNKVPEILCFVVQVGKYRKSPREGLGRVKREPTVGSSRVKIEERNAPNIKVEPGL
ncbi:hypothetical protein WICPIJ_005264 [Wickerhamomyces pijperi]|uniref:Uncharacterized protein n=1 Tax=Wickerhamomyces pijperi TaxID=599730 RepID=A0A9P8Q606_WICPI|nr:hypothetical protein WICPIJ_005264 [Wickerhamomyces pijperi]